MPLNRELIFILLLRFSVINSKPILLQLFLGSKITNEEIITVLPDHFYQEIPRKISLPQEKELTDNFCQSLLLQ